MADGIRFDLMQRAQAGDANAQFEVSACYHLGNGVPQDYETALKWCLLAAEQGHSRAQFNVGSFYLHGVCVDADAGEALRWYERAAENGDPELLFNIAHVLDKQNEQMNAWPLAMRCYKAAADGGYAEAQCSLGIKLFLGRGIDQDQQAGLTYLFKAADQQHADTFGLLGHLHAEGHLGEPDRAMALYYFRMAERRGHPEAQRWADDLAEQLTADERAKAEDVLGRAAEAGRRYEQETGGEGMSPSRN